MAETIAIKFVQGSEQWVVQDLAQVLGLLAGGISFSGNEMTLKFQWVSQQGETDNADDVTARVTRQAHEWIERARLAADGGGEPVELWVKHGAIMDEPTYGRGFIRWEVLGGRVEQASYPSDIPKERAFDLVLVCRSRYGKGREVPVIKACGYDFLRRGAGGWFGHVQATLDGECGLEITGGAQLAIEEKVLDHRAGTASLHWKPVGPKLAYAAGLTPCLRQVVYDIRHDVDGGMWWTSDEAKATSWYDELGAWPVITVWEINDTVISVRSGIDQGVHMNFSLAVNSALHVSNTGSMRISSVAVLNRRAYVGITSDGVNDNGGLVEIDFENDRCTRLFVATEATGPFEYAGPISQRNAGLGYTERGFIINRNITNEPQLPHGDVYDVSVAYVQGRGLWIAAATGAGVYTFNVSGYPIQFDVTTYNVVKCVWVTSDGTLYWNGTDGGANLNRLYVLVDAAAYTSGTVTDVFDKVYTVAADPALKGAAGDAIRTIWVQERGGWSTWSWKEWENDLIVVGGDAGVSVIYQKRGDWDDGGVQYWDVDRCTSEIWGLPLGWWAGGLETGATLADRSRAGNALTANAFSGGGGALAAGDWDTALPVRGPSIIFTGTQYLSSVAAAFNVANQALTCGATVRLSSLGAARCIMNKGFGAGQRAWYLGIDASNNFLFQVSIDGTNWVTATCTGIAAQADTWYSVIGVYDAGVVTVFVFAEDGYAWDADYNSTSGNIAGSTDAFRVGTEATGTTRPWNGRIASIFVYKDAPAWVQTNVAGITLTALYYDIPEIWRYAMTSLSAAQQAYTLHELGGGSNQANQVCVSDDGELLLVATGDGAADGCISTISLDGHHQERAARVISAEPHRAVAYHSGVFVASNDEFRCYQAPYQNAYFFDSSMPLRHRIGRWVGGHYAYYDYSDSKIKLKAGRTTLLLSSAVTWTFGQVKHVAFRWGYPLGVGIWYAGASVGSSATYSGAYPLSNRLWYPTVSVYETYDSVTGWRWTKLACDYRGLLPAGGVYDFAAWSKELASAVVIAVERGRGEMPVSWSQYRAGAMYNNGPMPHSSQAHLYNVPGDAGAGVRMFMTNYAARQWFVGLKAGHDAPQFRGLRLASKAVSLDGDTVVYTTDTTAVGGACLQTTPATTAEVQRADVVLSSNMVQALRMSGRYRLMARVKEVGATPTIKLRFGFQYISAQEYGWLGEQQTLPATGAWMLLDCGEFVFPPSMLSDWHKGQHRDRLDIEDYTRLFGLLNYFVQRPSGTNTLQFDALYLMPVDYAFGMAESTALGSPYGLMLASIRGGEFGASQIERRFGQGRGDDMHHFTYPATWTGGEVYAPIGPDGCAILSVVTDYESWTSSGGTPATLYGMRQWITPYFMWVR